MTIKKRGKAKKIRKKTKSTEVVYHSTKEIKVERALIENFIGLQKVMVGLSAKFDSLTSQISKLLQLFEVSARELARKEISSSNLDAKRVMEKLDNLSAQAGLIGRGLALIHEIGTESRKPVIPLKMPDNRPAAVQPHAPFSSLLMEPKPAQKITQEIRTESPEKNQVSRENAP